MKLRSLAEFGLDLQLAAAMLQNPLTQRQPKTVAKTSRTTPAGLDTIKDIKDMADIFLGNALTGVCHGNSTAASP